MNELIEDLLIKANIIFNETATGANTHTRIGQMFIDIINLLATKQPALKRFQRTGYTNTNINNQNSMTSGLLTATATRYFPFLVESDCEVTALSVWNTSTAAGSAYFALFNDNGTGYPGSIHPDFPQTTILTTASGIKSITPASPVKLAAGLYWVALYVTTTINWRISAGNTQWRMLPTSPALSPLTSGQSNYFHTTVTGTFADPAPASMGQQAIENLVAWFTFV